MKRKILIVFSGFAVMVILSIISCDNFIEKCGPFDNKFYVTDLYWDEIEGIYENGYIVDSAINRRVAFDKYAIHAYAHIYTYTASDYKKSVGFFNEAYACEPVIPTTDDKITDIQIYCTNDFNTGHPQGTNLADLFNIVIFEQNSSQNYTLYPLDEFLLEEQFASHEFYLMLNVPPDSEGEYQFTVKYYQDGGKMEYAEYISNPVTISLD